MKAVVFAYGMLGAPGFDAVRRHGFEIVAAVTHKDAPGERLYFESVAERAAAAGVPVFAPPDPAAPGFVEAIRAMRPDVLFSFYYRQLLPEALLEIVAGRAYNLHGSLLPKYRGRSPLNWALLHGESETGVTLHRMERKADAGPIVGAQPVPIGPDDDAGTLAPRMVEAARVLLDRVLPDIAAGRERLTPQDESQATTFHGRRPEDGLIHWDWTPERARNLVRAVASPFPGAFTHFGKERLTIWKAQAVPRPAGTEDAPPGTVLSVAPLEVACGDGALRILSGQLGGGTPVPGAQMASLAGLARGCRLGAPPKPGRRPAQKVLILGVNGFIGNALTERLLAEGGYEVYGMDLANDKLAPSLRDPRFTFCEGDISIQRDWIEYHVRKCDVVLPLVAIATPANYVREPLRVFELDFEENLRVVRYCVKYGRRLIFPSTSEVYGMCEDAFFDEDASPLVTGPINKIRWIYSSSKQLLDRVIWAFGLERGLRFTLFRPFNWIGPRLDSLDSARLGSSRVLTQFALNLVEGTPIRLVDGGAQKRCFTDLSDGIECLFRIVANAGGAADGRIFNIGNPDNEASVRELAETMVACFERHPRRSEFPATPEIIEVDSKEYYGAGYQDVVHRRPSIRNAQRHLGWTPKVGLRDAIANALDYFVRERLEEMSAPSSPMAHPPS